MQEKNSRLLLLIIFKIFGASRINGMRQVQNYEMEMSKLAECILSRDVNASKQGHRSDRKLSAQVEALLETRANC
jgi:hypothetical protein